MEISHGNWLCRAIGTAGLVLGIVLPAGAGEAQVELQAPALVAPSLGCGAAPATAALFTQVAQRKPRQHSARRAPRRHHAEATPEAPADPVPSLSHAYFTCSSTPLVALPVGAGWLAVGPQRRS
jgi:hypothetical protein